MPFKITDKKDTPKFQQSALLSKIISRKCTQQIDRINRMQPVMSNENKEIKQQEYTFDN